MSIWHLMQREMKSRKTGITDICQFDLSLEELRSVTGTTDKFERLSQFRAKVLNKALEEIKDNCGVVINYNDIKKSRKVIAFHFIVRSLYYIDPVDISPETMQRVTDHKRRMEESK